MCLIIAPGKDGQPALLPRDAFNYAYSRNDDGFGAMWTEDGRVNHLKMLGLSADEEYDKMKELTEQHPDVIFHMRFKTHGQIIPSLCHPFRVLHKNRHGRDLFFMHNGVLSGFGKDLSYGQNDTTAFKDKILIPLLTRNPDALDDPAIWEQLEKITQGSRLIFLDSEGKVYRTSENSWNNRYDLTLSNTYMLPAVVRELPVTGNYASGGHYDPVRDEQGEKYPIWRQIRQSDGSLVGQWFKEVAPGLIRSRYGTLFKDRGYGNVLSSFDSILKSQEVNAFLDATEKSENKLVSIPSEDDLNDDLPFEDASSKKTRSKSGDLASQDERLRYARIVHNCHDGRVVHRTQLIADLLGMSNKEMYAFIKEDPENAETIMAELIEIVFEYNDLAGMYIEEDELNKELIFDMDELVELNELSHHQESMKTISDMRKEYYRKLAEMAAAVDEAKRQEQSKNKSNKKPKKERKVA